MVSFIESIMQNLDEASNLLELDESTKEAIKMPKKELHVTIPVRMDDGTIKRFKGFRVQHNDSLGYTKGGIRLHPDETIDTVRSLASLMCWKVSLAELPIGGAKGGIICDTKEMSLGETERLSRGYIRAIADSIGYNIDVPAPDVYSNPQIMAFMMDEFEILKGYHDPGVVTGKPIILGGSLGRGNATAKGGMYALHEAAKKLNINLIGATVAIQGFGNAGYHAAKLCKEMFGAKIVAISDSKGAIFNYVYGFNPDDVKEHKSKTGSVVGYLGAMEISNEKLLELEVDVLIPSALENVITIENAKNIKTKIVLELANGPTTPDADKILHKNGVHVIPDLLANSGGVIVSHFENVQNRQAFYWSEQEVYKLLNDKITHMYKGVYDLHKKKNITMRMAVFMISISRVVEAMKLRGAL